VFHCVSFWFGLLVQPLILLAGAANDGKGVGAGIIIILIRFAPVAVDSIVGIDVMQDSASSLALHFSERFVFAFRTIPSRVLVSYLVFSVFHFCFFRLVCCLDFASSQVI
jgi:hypothetical protein